MIPDMSLDFFVDFVCVLLNNKNYMNSACFLACLWYNNTLIYRLFGQYQFTIPLDIHYFLHLASGNGWFRGKNKLAIALMISKYVRNIGQRVHYLI